jgi:hypothetical protein
MELNAKMAQLLLELESIERNAGEGIKARSYAKAVSRATRLMMRRARRVPATVPQ